MNNIDTIITHSDRIDAQSRSAATLASKALNALCTAAPYSTTFIEGIPQDQKEQVEEQLKKRFEVWANSWIAPLCRQIASKGDTK